MCGDCDDKARPRSVIYIYVRARDEKVGLILCACVHYSSLLLYGMVVLHVNT